MDAQLARQLASTYRAILRIHRTQLPGPLRDVGDSFVRAEFGSVLKASKTSKAPTRPQLDEFLTHWEGYAAMLRPPASSDPASSAGHHAPAVEALRQVSEGLDEYLTAEQKLRVDSLKREAHDLGVSMLAKQASDTSEQPTDGKK